MRFFLNFYEQASQVWLDKYVIYLVLLIIKLYLFKISLINGITLCQEKAQLACESLQTLLNQMSQIPSAMSQIMNYLIQSFINNLLKQLRMLLRLAIGILKGAIGFAIELYLGTLTCLCTAFVTGALELLTDATRTITEAVELAVNEFLKVFNSALDGLSTVVNGFVTTINAIKSFFSGSDTDDILTSMNTVNLTASTIKNISIPTGFIDELSSLSSKIPSYEDVLSNLTSLVTEPLDLLYVDVESQFSVNETLQLSSFSYVRKDTTLKICNSLEQEFDQVKKVMSSICSWLMLGVGLTLMVVIAILLFIMYRSCKRRKRYVEDLILENDPRRIGNVLEIQRNRFGIYLSSLNISHRLKWLANYSFSTSARNCLFLGLAGLTIVGLQYWLLIVASRKLDGFITGMSFDSQNSQLRSNFKTYLADSQSALNELLESLNSALFDSINTTSASLYDTLISAEGTVNNSISSVFGGTVFDSAIRTVVYCTIGRKIDKIEDGLLWIQNNLFIEFPVFSEEEILGLIMSTLEDATDSNSNLATQVRTVSDTMISSFKKSFLVELIVSLVFIGVWLFVVLLGLLILTIREFLDQKVLPTVISMPKPLNKEAMFEYDYPVNDPFVRVSSSVYTDSCARSSSHHNK